MTNRLYRLRKVCRRCIFKKTVNRSVVSSTMLLLQHRSFERMALTQVGKKKYKNEAHRGETR